MPAAIVSMMWRFFLVGIVALGAVGCQGARSVLPVALSPSELALPADPRLLTTHEAAVRGIGAVLARELALPLPNEVTVFVYGSRRTFEDRQNDRRQDDCFCRRIEPDIARLQGEAGIHGRHRRITLRVDQRQE